MIKCLHPLGMNCASCKSDTRVATVVTSETITQPYIYRYVDVQIAVASAVEQENKRIIELLEDNCECKEMEEYGYRQCAPHYAVELIEGQRDNETVVFLTREQAEQLAEAILEE